MGKEASKGERLTHVDDDLLSRLANNDSSVSPREIVHGPEGVEREVEREVGDGKDVEYHPSDHVPFSSEEEDQSLETVDDGQHDDGEGWDGLSFGGNEVYEVCDLQNGSSSVSEDRGRGKQAGNTYVCNRNGSNDGRQQIDEDDESHREAAETAQLFDEDELGQVMDGRVDPSTTLGQQDAPLIGRNGLS